MRILVFSWRDPKHPTAGGAEQVMHEHMKGWLDAGHKVTLFSSRVKGLPKKETFNGVKIVRCGDQYLGVKIAAFLFWLKNKNNYDFVVDQFHGIPFFTPFYVNKPKLAVLQEVAKSVWFLNELPIPFNWVVGSLGYFFEPVIFLFYKNVSFMVGSESARDDLIKFGIPSKNITVVSHGVILQKPDPFPEKEKIKTIIFLGALSKDKGVEDAIKVFSILDKKNRYQFWVIGRGSSEYKKVLLSICQKLEIAGKVIFWGFVSQEKKFELLAKAHILINPSAREGWGLVNIEANAMGTPVIAYQSPGLVDSVKDNQSGIICKANRPDFMAKEVVKLINNENLYRKFQQGARDWSKKFSWQKSRKLSLDLITSSSL